jgi:hypothetical protein
MTDLPASVFQVLQYGISGFAVVLLYLGYRLLNQLFNFQGDDKNLKSKVTLVIIFMVTSLIFFFGGIFGQEWVHEQSNPVYVLITPNHMPDGVDLPTVRRGIEVQTINNNGAIIKVKYNDQITLQLDALIKKIDDLKNTIPHVAAINATLRTE